MKAIARSLVVVLVALIAVPALVVATAITSAVQLLAVTGFYMGGTQHPLSIPPDTAQFITDYMNLADQNYIVPATGVAPNPRIPVVYPAQVAPFSPFLSTSTLDNSVQVGRNNLDSCLRGGPCNDGPAVQPTDTFDVYGYSLSAIVVSLAKQDLMANPGSAPADTNFFLIANPMRPNGGILARGFEGMTIPLVGITFYGPTPNSCDADPCTAADAPVYDTVDVAQQYDFLGGDAPMRPLNILAMTNSIMAYALLHGAVPEHSLDEGGLIDQGQYGDTHYYMIAADTLPILQPLVMAGVPAPALALPDAILRVWIEDAYDRDSSPGEHVTFNYIPIGDPIGLIGNTLGAIPVGIDDTVDGFAGLRPLGTEPAGPFGVGGPEVERTPSPLNAPAAAPQLTVVQDEQTTTPGENKPAKDPVKADDLGNDTNTPNAGTPEAIKPSLPFEKWREGLKAEPGNRPLGIRPGEGPISRAVNALTGQRPTSGSQTPADNEPASESPAA